MQPPQNVHLNDQVTVLRNLLTLQKPCFLQTWGGATGTSKQML